MPKLARMRAIFRIEDVIEGLSAKMIRRHPHVFGDRTGGRLRKQVLQNWQEIKKQEKGRRRSPA